MEKTDNEVTFPILSMEAMAPRLCQADEIWEPVMSFPFPANPSSKLLQEARRQVLAYLNWITSDIGITSEGPDWSIDETRRACARLIEITELFPFVFDAEREAEFRALYGKECLGTVEKSEDPSSLPTIPPKEA